MYDIVFDGEKYWITYNGKRLEDLGSFIEPISPKVIIQEIKDEV